jgi:hypothetical protein
MCLLHSVCSPFQSWWVRTVSSFSEYATLLASVSMLPIQSRRECVVLDSVSIHGICFPWASTLFTLFSFGEHPSVYSFSECPSYLRLVSPPCLTPVGWDGVSLICSVFNVSEYASQFRWVCTVFIFSGYAAYLFSGEYPAFISSQHAPHLLSVSVPCC